MQQAAFYGRSYFPHDGRRFDYRCFLHVHGYGNGPDYLERSIDFAVGAGVLTVLIRLLGGYPEGVCYSILLMNAVTPLIDLTVKPRIFGSVKVKAKEAE